MEPRIAGSVSRAEDTQETPRESRACQCRNCASTFPGPILFKGRRTTSLDTALVKGKAISNHYFFDDIYVPERCER